MHFIDAISDKTTIIGKRYIKPRSRGVEITDEEYQKYKDKIDHYVDKGTIRVTSPNDKDYIRKQDLLAKRIEIQSKVGKIPPKSNKVNFTGVEEVVDAKCFVTKDNGDRCKSNKVAGYRVCIIHKKQIEGGKELIGCDGEAIGQYNYKEV